jgi:hypothetical protein
VNLIINTIATIAGSTMLAIDAFAQSIVVSIDNEPLPNLIVEPPLPDQLAKDLAFMPYRVENLRILPVGEVTFIPHGETVTGFRQHRQSETSTIQPVGSAPAS